MDVTLHVYRWTLSNNQSSKQPINGLICMMASHCIFIDFILTFQPRVTGGIVQY
jgi:hypothetical protein